MKLIYAKNVAVVNEIGTIANPDYYENPKLDTAEVIIYGDYPQIQSDYKALGISVEVRKLEEPAKTNLTTLNVAVGITPELQEVIDNSKAECEKLVTENENLKLQVEALRVVHRENSELISENSRLKEQLLLANNALNQTTTERDDAVTKVQSLEKTVGELESKVKKLIAAEAKAAKPVDAGTQKE
ncbi:stress-responsive nuclear envelope protein [Acinetobacter soli]|uniref:stress-responsive nuclear envelope protein n=1 Tax=Acinetobacter soli TaxID=487316 RepID=UPI000E5A6BE2|nr:stress-responsive nuclear envelope protein [Acinetobacter soli]